MIDTLISCECIFEKHHAAELAEIEHIENQIEVVDAAIQTARNDIFSQAV